MGDFAAAAHGRRGQGGKVVASLSANEVALEEENEAVGSASNTYRGSRQGAVERIEVRDCPQDADMRRPGALSTQELQQIAADQAELASMITAFAEELADQQEGLDTMDANTAVTVDNMVAGLEELVKAQQLQGWTTYKMRSVAMALVAGGVAGGLALTGVGVGLVGVAAVAAAGGLVGGGADVASKSVVSAAMHTEVKALKHERAHGKILGKGAWTPDAEASHCQIPSCGTAFSFTIRRHHCRVCGGVFCWKCAPQDTIRTCVRCKVKQQRSPATASVASSSSAATDVRTPSHGDGRAELLADGGRRRARPPSSPAPNDHRSAEKSAVAATRGAVDAATAAAVRLADQGEQIDHIQSNAELAAGAAARVRTVSHFFSFLFTWRRRVCFDDCPPV